MGTYRRDNQESVNAFLIRNTYYFKHYFIEEDVFAKLKDYYNNYEYRFEVPITDFEEIQEFVAEFGYELIEISDLEEYIVVKEKYTAHPDGIFKKSVITTHVKGYNCFLMKDQSAVETFLKKGGIRFTELTIKNPFDSR